MVDDDERRNKKAPSRRESVMMGLAISCKSIANEVEKELSASDVKVKFADRAIARVGQLVSETVTKHYVKDIFAFANHAKRQFPDTDDVKLLYRRNPEIGQRVEALLGQPSSSGFDEAAEDQSGNARNSLFEHGEDPSTEAALYEESNLIPNYGTNKPASPKDVQSKLIPNYGTNKPTSPKDVQGTKMTDFLYNESDSKERRNQLATPSKSVQKLNNKAPSNQLATPSKSVQKLNNKAPKKEANFNGGTSSTSKRTSLRSSSLTKDCAVPPKKVKTSVDNGCGVPPKRTSLDKDCGVPPKRTSLDNDCGVPPKKIKIPPPKDSFYDEADDAEWAKQLLGKREIGKVKQNFAEPQNRAPELEKLPAAPPLFNQKTPTNGSLLKQTKNTTPIDDSFYKDDDEWAKLLAPVKQNENDAPKPSTPDKNGVQPSPGEVKLAQVNKEALTANSPLPTASSAPEIGHYPPTPILPGDWFQPESHSTPLNATFHQKAPNETLNLSIDTTPQRRFSQATTPKVYNLRKDHAPRVGGLFRPQRKK